MIADSRGEHTYCDQVFCWCGEYVVNKGSRAMVDSSRLCNHREQPLAEVEVYIFSSLRVGFIVQDVHIEIAQDLNATLFVLLVALYTGDYTAMNFNGLGKVSSGG